MGFYLIATVTGQGALAIFSQVILTFMLVRVTGAALLEKSLSKVKLGYEEYVRTTNSFFHWFPLKT